MKRLFRLLICSLLLAAMNTGAETSPHSDHDTTAVHGMVLFGDGPLYASHLGLYHHPHDRQIVLPVRFNSPARAREFEQWRAQFDGLITLAPKPFPLANLQPAGSFPYAVSVDIYAGHFERGGKKQFANVTLLLEKPLIYRELVADGQHQTQATFWRLPGKHSDFLVYRIGPKPDQDWILQTDVINACEQVPCELTIALPAGPHMALGNSVPLILEGKTVALNIKKSLYQEHKDFSF